VQAHAAPRVAVVQHHEAFVTLGLAHVGDSHCEAETLWLIGRAHGEAGRAEPALSLRTRALEMIRSVGDRDDEFRVLTDLARVHLALGATAEALHCAELAVTIAEDLRSRDGLGAALVELSRALCVGHERERALKAARRAAELLDSTGSSERWRAYAALADTEVDANAAGVARERSSELLAQLRR
jgi:tetratricopeptide (TPR) repeat protein